VARILVTEELAPSGVAALTKLGHDVDVRLDLDPPGLLAAVAGAHALIVRSATQVTAAVIEAGRDLVVVGRAGIGLDNVDVAAATARGVTVVNAPQSNILSAAEHTMALLLAQARNIPQAHAALIGGKWERSRWEGVELHGKTLGIVGLGRVGALVAQRALAFGMRLIAHDPYVSPERARQLGIELVALDDLVAQADFITLHVAKSKETVGLIGRDLLARARPGLRIINTSRGGIVDEDALADAIRSGRVAGAALDVFAVEPTTSSPLFDLDVVVVTPHLGASTREAQDKAGVTIAEQVALALAGEFVPFAVNIDASEASETVRPFLPLAEQLGRIFASLVSGLPDSLDVEYQGGLADYDTRILTLSMLKGLLSAAIHDPVSFVNAPQMAVERGLTWRETKSPTSPDYVNLVTVRGGGHAIAGTIAGTRSEPRIVMVDDHTVDLPPARHLLIVRNDDRPGMIGAVGTALGAAGLNIVNMAIGQSPQGETALMALSTTEEVPADVQAQLRGIAGILDVAMVSQGD
jgi:D-3-phosphoglycerate dehydrogenase / 2-oxoglutarate reductase